MKVFFCTELIKVNILECSRLAPLALDVKEPMTGYHFYQRDSLLETTLILPFHSHALVVAAQTEEIVEVVLGADLIDE